MIQPIVNSLTSSGLGQAAPILDQPNAQPQPATQVMPAAETGSEQAPQTLVGTGTQAVQKYPEPSKSSLEKALDSVNDSLKAWSTGMRFDMDKDAQRLVISIVDSSTGKVLRTIPSEAVLRVAKMIAKFQGSGVDTQA
ncbi:MAG: flagellar protein FlaG [Castellaniella sp.]|uniref:flagellar protein FlaG n=1 Tax=Castellaniella sp. TaxID=1955812 RepID=UPI00122450F1|nr:flagellar protein FlaG [Castellaniella sp.]TAN27738.1 MAG: flagellar protein FlaG [Castellaniella sp.]